MESKELINLIKQYPFSTKFLHCDNTLNEILNVGAYNYYGDELIIELDDEREFVINNSIKELKPILRPLSLLTEEIEHEGEKFTPLEKIDYLFRINKQWYEWKRIILGDEYKINNLPFEIIRKFIEWKFDVFLGIGDWAISTEDERLKGVKVY